MKRKFIIFLGVGILLVGIGYAFWPRDQDRQTEPELFDGPYLRLGFDKLSDFPYEVHEVYGASGGRPLLKSDSVIPDRVKQYNGRRVRIRGFVLPLRFKKGLVTEFLLLRDQGACCFGDKAQINHFIRIKQVSGTMLKPGLTTPVQVYGTLNVGETYVEGYLTGIYALEADKVDSDPDP